MPFIYNKPVSGKDNVGRRTEVQVLINLIAQGENVVMYDVPGSGKTSVIRQAFFNMRLSARNFTFVEFSLLNCRTVADLMMRLGSAVLKTCCSTPSDFLSATGKYLSGTHFVFDNSIYATRGQVLSLNWDIDDNDIRSILSLPYRIALDKFQKIVMVLDDFQNVMMTEDGNKVCRILSDVFDNPDPAWKEWCSFILCGNMVNAMKEIFERNHLLFRHINRLELNPIDGKEMSEFIIKRFLETGKVIERPLLAGVTALFDNHPGYIIHFASLCDDISKGYMTEAVLMEALETLVSIHSLRFKQIMNDLTTFQVCFLRAVLDGHTRLTGIDVISRYNLSSAANVKRLRDALCKKEIITMNGKDEPSILDPLFKYWVNKYFFERIEI